MASGEAIAGHLIEGVDRIIGLNPIDRLGMSEQSHAAVTEPDNCPGSLPRTLNLPLPLMRCKIYRPLRGLA